MKGIEYVKKCDKICHKCKYLIQIQQGKFIISYCKLQASRS